jgi:hypothetical protein
MTWRCPKGPDNGRPHRPDSRLPPSLPPRLTRWSWPSSGSPDQGPDEKQSLQVRPMGWPTPSPRSPLNSILIPACMSCMAERKLPNASRIPPMSSAAVTASTCSPLVLRRGDRGGGTPARFSTHGSREDDGEPRSKGPKRFARSAICTLLRDSVVLPPSPVLKFFLDCGQHVSPRLSEAPADSSDCPGPQSLAT